MKKSVLIIDDHRLITDCVPRLLQNQFRIVAAHNSKDALAQLSNGRFDAIILDLDLQEGAQSVDLVDVALANTSAVLVFYDELSEADFRISRRRGVRAFVGKHESANRLYDGVQATIAAREFMPPDLQAKAVGGVNDAMPKMSPRIWFALDALCRDPIKDNNTLAAEFGLSVGRVKNMLTELYRLFGVQTRHQLVAEAARRGFKPGDPYAQRVMKGPAQSDVSEPLPHGERRKPQSVHAAGSSYTKLNARVKPKPPQSNQANCELVRKAATRTALIQPTEKVA